MPCALQASRIVAPSGTVTSAPSIRTVTASRSSSSGSSLAPRGNAHRRRSCDRMRRSTSVSVTRYATPATAAVCVTECDLASVSVTRSMVGPVVVSLTVICDLRSGRGGSPTAPRPTRCGRARRSRRRASPSPCRRSACCVRRPATPRSAISTSTSCWRTTPTRHGTHCPHDSFLKNSAMRRTSAVKSTVSSNSVTTPEPSVAPAARVASRESWRSS